MYGNTKVLYMPDVQMRTGRKCPQAYVGGFVETLDVELLLEDAAVMEDILKIKAFYEDEATSQSMWRGEPVPSTFPIARGRFRGFELGPECRWLRMDCYDQASLW